MYCKHLSRDLKRHSGGTLLISASHFFAVTSGCTFPLPRMLAFLKQPALSLSLTKSVFLQGREKEVARQEGKRISEFLPVI